MPVSGRRPSTTLAARVLIRLLHHFFPWTHTPPLPRQQRLERCLIHGGPIGAVAPGVWAWGDRYVTIRHASAESPEAVIAELADVPPDPFPNCEDLVWTTRAAAAALLGPGENDEDGRYWRCVNQLEAR